MINNKEINQPSYLTPEVTVLVMSAESILCASTQDNENEPWGEEDLW